MKLQQVVIYGAGGFGREAAWLVQSCSISKMKYEIVCFIDDNESIHNSEINGILVLSLLGAKNRFPEAKIVIGNGIPQTRVCMVNNAVRNGFGFLNFIHPKVERSQWIDIGTGVMICAGNILTTNISIGDHVLINLDCTIGHDVKIDDYSTLSPGTHVSGYVNIGKRVFIGTGAVIVNGTQETPIIIGDDVTVGAGACVVGSIPPGVTVLGVPAKIR
jgi:sugar O-acyltransferase (sialic acid O-acetyltransferase NeuD family)